VSLIDSLLGKLKVSFAGMFKGQMKQTITGNTGHVVAAQSKGAPAKATFTMTPVIEKLVMQPAENVEDVVKKIDRLVQGQLTTTGKKPGGIIVDEREFNLLLRDIPPGSSHGLLKVHKETQISYESVITYDGVVVNRIAGFGLEKPK
jgi:hypothetical protein